MSDLSRAYYQFYGIKTNDWKTTWGTLADHEHILVKDYLNSSVSTASNTAWSSAGIKFLYPHNIEETYYLEGVIEGQVTFTSEGAGVKSCISDFIVNVYKFGADNSETLIATTGTIDVSAYVLNYVGEVGEYFVYPFWIDVFAAGKEITQNERLVIWIKWDGKETSTTTARLSHENWKDGEDIKIKLPFKL